LVVEIFFLSERERKINFVSDWWIRNKKRRERRREKKMSHTFVGSQNSNLSLLCDLKIESIHPMQQSQQHPAHQHGKVD